MKTKTLLLSAVAGAIGLASASAQVYSVNAVGYINVTIPPGFSMISNQLQGEDMSLDSVLPNPPLNTRVLKWDGAQFVAYDFVDIGIGTPIWSPNGDATLAPGEGAFIQNPGSEDFSVTFVGEVPQLADSNITLPAGFSIASSTVPQNGGLETDMGFPVELNDRVLKWNGSAYVAYDYVDIGIGSPIWSPSEPTVSVSESFFVQKANAASWDRNFSVN